MSRARSATERWRAYVRAESERLMHECNLSREEAVKAVMRRVDLKRRLPPPKKQPMPIASIISSVLPSRRGGDNP